MPTVNFPTAAQDPTAAGVLSLGKVYIGVVDEDPTVLANRISVTITQQDGTPVVIAPNQQPFVLNGGGLFTYNGSVVTLTADTSYSMKVLTSGDVQAYYLPNSGAGQTVESDLITLTALGSEPAFQAGTGKLFTMTVAGIVEFFYMDSTGQIVQFTSNGALNIDLGSQEVSAAILNALYEVTGLQFRGEPITLAIDGSGNVECDVTLGLNYSLTLDQDVGTFSFTNAPSGRVPNICVEIINTGSYTITTFQVNTVGATIWIPDAVASLAPTANKTTSYGLALMPGARFHIFPVLMKQVI